MENTSRTLKPTFEGAVVKYGDTCLRVAAAVTGNMDDAHDIVQDSYIKAFQNWDSYDPSRSFIPWMAQIIRNTYLDRIRKIQRDRRLLESAREDYARSGDFRKDMKVRETQELVQDAIKLLSDPEREVIDLNHFAGLPYDEIASTLGIKIGTVMSRLFYARKHLREIIEKRFTH